MLQTLQVHRARILGFMLLLIQSLLMATPAHAAEDAAESLLQAQVGEKRPILIFGADTDDKAVAQISALWSKRPALAERDIVLVRVQRKQVVIQRPGRSDDGRSKEVETFADPDLAKAFRKRFEVPNKGFAVVLIGKDGTVKRHSDLVLDAADIFQQIDGMPMRQNEMKRS